MTYTRPAAIAKIDRIMAMLKQRPRTVFDVAEALPMSKRHAQSYLNHLMAERRIHIKRWVRHIDQRDRMYPRPVYAAGEGVDAEPPAPLTPRERRARAWAVIKADPERHLDYLQRKRVARTDAKGPRADRAAAWMYGEAA